MFNNWTWEKRGFPSSLFFTSAMFCLGYVTSLQKRSLWRSEFIKPTSSRNYNIIWYLKPLSVSFLKEKVKDAAESEARNVTSYITSLILKDLKEKELVWKSLSTKKEDLISSNFLYSNNVSYIRGGKISAPP